MTAKAKPDPATAPLDAIDPKKALVPSVLRLNEMRVRKGFWPKVVRLAPGGGLMLLVVDAITSYVRVWLGPPYYT